jgi:Leucine-rich repeat (LRR) protein
MKKIWWIFGWWLVIIPLQAQKDQASLQKWEPQVRALIGFFEYTLNLLGNDSTPAADKDILIHQTYARIFRDAHVQIEDDLVLGRKAVTYKDVTAYLRDVDFFYTHLSFQLRIESISLEVKPNGKPFFMVFLQRKMEGMGIDGEKIQFTGPRFIEIDVDLEKQDLKIVSVYTHPLETNDELTNWWSSLPLDWKKKLGQTIQLPSGVGRLSDILTMDSLAKPGNRYDVAGHKIKLEAQWIGPGIARWLQLDSLNLAGETWLTQTEPLSRFTRLRYLNLSGTNITNVDGLRNLNRLQTLDLSRTRIQNLQALQYIPGLKSLLIQSLKGSAWPNVPALVTLEKLDLSFNHFIGEVKWPEVPELQELYIKGGKGPWLVTLPMVPALRILHLSESSITTLGPLQAFPELVELHMEKTNIQDLSPLLPLSKLKIVFCDGATLQPRHVQDMIRKMPSVLIVFGTEQLKTWWVNLPDAWQKVFRDHEPSLGVSGLPGTEALHALLRLKSLRIPKAGFTDLQPLKFLPALTFLDISGNPIEDVSPLLGLVGLEVLHANQIPKLSLPDIRPLHRLREIKVNGTPLFGISTLSSFKNLQMLEAEGYPHDSLVPYQGQFQILWHTHALTLWWDSLAPIWKSIFLQHVGAIEVTPQQLHAIEGIQKLRISGITLPNLSPLQQLKRLQHLELVAIGWSDLSDLEGLTQLTYVDVSQNPIANLSPIRFSRQLHTLILQRTAVADLSSIQVFIHLKKLDLSLTKVKKLEGLERLVYLEWLDISGLSVKNLKPLNGLSLRYLGVVNTGLKEKTLKSFFELNPELSYTYY